MSVISLNGFGDSEFLDNFVKAWNDAEKTTQKRKDIFLSSPGGHVDVFMTIQEMINSCPSKCSVTAVGEIHSAAFELFFSVTCERKILPFTFGMYHFGYDEILIDEKGKAKEDYGKAKLENLKLMQKHTFSFCKQVGMSAAEVKKIRDGKDVYFQCSRLNHFLKHQKANL